MNKSMTTSLITIMVIAILKKTRALSSAVPVAFLLSLLVQLPISAPLHSSPLLIPKQHIREQAEKKSTLLVQRFEKGFTAFSQSVLKVFQTHEKRIRPQTLTALKEPLFFFMTNQSYNPHKVYAEYRHHAKRQKPETPLWNFPNNTLFYYSVLPKQYRQFAAAGFKMTHRIMYINPEYRPNSIFDNLVAFHEMVHALQDTTLRNHLATQGKQGKKLLKTYIASLQRHERDPDLEPVAYAMELELLNILLKGKIRRIVKSGRALPQQQLARLLGIHSNSGMGSLKILLKYAYYYFKDDCWIYAYTRRYRQIILRDHMKIGQRFTPSENRFIKQ